MLSRAQLWKRFKPSYDFTLSFQIGEFQQALQVRDDIIRQISTSLQERTQERDAIQEQLLGVQDKMDTLQLQLTEVKLNPKMITK